MTVPASAGALDRGRVDRPGLGCYDPALEGLAMPKTVRIFGKDS